MTVPLIVTAVCCFVVAALLQATTGFGFALVFVPLLSLTHDLKTVVAVSVLAGPISALPAVVQLRRHVDWRLVAWLLAGSLVGAPLGTLLLDAASATLLRVLVSATILASTLTIVAGA